MQRLLLGFARRAVRLYYRVAHLGGDVPARGPVLLVGNHPNGLVDPVLLAGTTSRLVRFLGKAPLFEMPVLGQVMRGMDVLPVYRSQDGADTGDNARTFEAVFAALARGELVCLFPEGKSHDEPALAKLKTGAARMALGAEAKGGWTLGVVVVPVGLVYRAKPSFRSRVAVWTGAPLAVAPLRELFERDERAAVAALNQQIADGLRGVTLELERWEDLPLLELAERIRFDERAPAELRLERVQAFAQALRTLRATEPERVAELGERIAAFGERLARLDLCAADLHKLELVYAPALVARFVLRNLMLLVLGLPLAALGAVFWIVPQRVAGALPRRFATPDTLATGRILAGFVFFPLWLGGACALLAWRSEPRWSLILALGAPPLGLVALAFRDWRLAVLGEVRTFLRLVSHERLRQLLLAERAELARELEELRARL
ncbi:MAG: acyltransferase [Planctomycetes bacterium]|nr:acyltransferase [Planctomycetota bacterium]